MSASVHAATAAMPGGLEPLSVSLGALPATRPGATRIGPWMQASDDEVLVVFPRTRLRVRAGRHVTLDLPDGTTLADVPHLLYGWAARIALTQRGVVTAHASVVARDGVAVAVAGRAHAGKSTAVMALRERGWVLVCDDVAALAPEGVDGSGVAVLPFARPVHLAPASAMRFGIDPAQGVPLPGRTKHRHEVGSTREPVRLAALVDLVSVAADAVGAPEPEDGVRAQRLVGAAAFDAVRQHTRFWGLAELPGALPGYVPMVARVASHPITRVERRRADDTVERVAAAVEAAAHGVRVVAP